MKNHLHFDLQTFEFIGSQWRKVTELTETQLLKIILRFQPLILKKTLVENHFPYRQPDGSIRA